MKFLLLLPLVILTACQSHTIHQTISQPTIQHTDAPKSNDTLIVFYDGDKKEEVLSLFKTLNAKIIYDYSSMSGFAIKVNPTELEKIKKTLENHSAIHGVNYDRIMSIH